MEVSWIKCTDQIPELEDDLCLVYSAKGADKGFPPGSYDCVHIEDYFKDITCGRDSEGNQLYTKWYISQGITHWMPYPKPPTE
ncbi:DUF551 domain-containing protein [Chimaeribacter arupi]|uniref:DUF551 domain-containing protein n=1 Tax=Chimaeribacter arupi TaxID=2060066 RepID=UPI002711F7A4|nr:DUF551 domain-containing protein [Chimaeribacter arupi]WKZ94068.1 DUF551 domain-containing protein [Chimaeribacter arupi]